MNLKPFASMIAVIITAALFCGCAGYTRVISGALQPIFVPSPQTVTSGERVITLPAGTYTAHFQDAEGVYYWAPSTMKQSAPSPWDLRGGLFIPNPDAKDQQQAVWLFGAFSELSRLPTKMTIIKLNERVEYLRGPTKVYDIY